MRSRNHDIPDPSLNYLEPSSIIDIYNQKKPVNRENSFEPSSVIETRQTAVEFATAGLNISSDFDSESEDSEESNGDDFKQFFLKHLDYMNIPYT